jgi:hypothetical protein
MATNDFIHDLVDKFAEEKIEYLVITVQKGKEEHKGNAYYNITTVDGLDIIATTWDHVMVNLTDDDDGPGELEFDGTDDSNLIS